MSETTEQQVIETAYLRLPGDPAILRDFIARAEADLANPTGLRRPCAPPTRAPTWMALRPSS